MSARGTLRIDRTATPPWQYKGELVLPAGRSCLIEASITEDVTGKFFALRAGLIPGMSAAELEAALSECELEKAEEIRRNKTGVEDCPDDELPF